MKKLLLMATVWTILNGCNGSSTSTASATDSSKSRMSDATSKEERNKQVVLASIKAYPTGNTDEILKDAAADIVDYGDGTRPPLKGLDSIKTQMKKVMGEWKTASPDFNVDKVVAAVSGDTVLVWGEFSGSWKGNFMGQKPTGKSYKMNGVDYFIFNDAGKIIEHRTTPGDAELARQLGMKM